MLGVQLIDVFRLFSIILLKKNERSSKSVASCLIKLVSMHHLIEIGLITKQASADIHQDPPDIPQLHVLFHPEECQVGTDSSILLRCYIGVSPPHFCNELSHKINLLFFHPLV